MQTNVISEKKNGFTFIIGTRPESIKITSIVECLINENFSHFNIINTGQQADLIFSLQNRVPKNSYVILNPLTKDYSLINFLVKIFMESTSVEKYIYNNVIVQGDTLSALAGSLYAKMTKRKLFHVESGLRSFNRDEPFPEEINRVTIDHLSDILFTSTEIARENLLREGINKDSIFHFGQTGIDILVSKYLRHQNLNHSKERIIQNNPNVLVTIHRRENYENIMQIGKVLSDLSQTRRELNIKYILHPNPKVSNLQIQSLNKSETITVLRPLKYEEMLDILLDTDYVLTDSGGLQEECGILNLPVFILRNSTERTEILSNTNVRLYENFMIDLKSKLEQFLSKTYTVSGLKNEIFNEYGNGEAGNLIGKYLISKFNEAHV